MHFLTLAHCLLATLSAVRADIQGYGIPEGFFHSPFNERHHNTSEQFLEANPQILVGRASLNKAIAELGHGNAQSRIRKPFENMILIDTSGKRNEFLFIVALLNDSAAEEAYKLHEEDGKAGLEVRSRCVGLGSEGNHKAIGKEHQMPQFEGPQCRQFCQRMRECTGDPDCSLCAFVGGFEPGDRKEWA